MAQEKKEEQKQMTMEDYLVSQLETRVKLKDGSYLTDPEDGHALTKQEAIATNILNLAMKGDIKAAQYINGLQLRAQLNKKNKS